MMQLLNDWSNTFVCHLFEPEVSISYFDLPQNSNFFILNTIIKWLYTVQKKFCLNIPLRDLAIHLHPLTINSCHAVKVGI